MTGIVKKQLVVNESKSNGMLVTTRQRLNHIEETRLDMYIGEFKLVQAGCIDYLGMKIDENISWNAQGSRFKVQIRLFCQKQKKLKVQKTLYEARRPL